MATVRGWGVWKQFDYNSVLGVFMERTDLNLKGLFCFTGNPIIDNGMSVLALMANSKTFYDITPSKILEGFDPFVNAIKHQYKDDYASESESVHVKKKLRQHLMTIYGTNHYVHGINNKSKYLKNVTVKINDFDEFHKKLELANSSFYLNVTDKKKEKIKIKVFKKNNTLLSRNEFEDFLNSLKLQCHFEIDKYVPATVESSEEYFLSLLTEIENILNDKSEKLLDIKRKRHDAVCNFCGKKSAIILSKDLFPMTSAIGITNLGVVHICKYCYIASLVFFFNLLNYKREEKKTGVYFYYHFADEKVMINNAMKQYEKLKSHNNMASLQSKIGSRFNVVFEDLYERVRTICEGSSPHLTVYFLLNHNEDLKVVYDVLSIPNGVLNFWLKLNTMNLSGEWAILFRKIAESNSYQAFLDGSLTMFGYYFRDNKRITLIYYLEEIVVMDKNLIKICETLSDQLIDYFKIKHDRKPQNLKNWTEEFYQYFSYNKAHEFFNNLFQMNNDYFRWTNGKNLISLTSAKILLDEFKQKKMLFGLIEYFILNRMDQGDRNDYLSYVNQKYNK
jgi:predicted RNA-binding protein with RPS1 domain